MAQQTLESTVKSLVKATRKGDVHLTYLRPSHHHQDVSFARLSDGSEVKFPAKFSTTRDALIEAGIPMVNLGQHCSIGSAADIALIRPDNSDETPATRSFVILTNGPILQFDLAPSDVAKAFGDDLVALDADTHISDPDIVHSLSGFQDDPEKTLISLNIDMLVEVSRPVAALREIFPDFLALDGRNSIRSPEMVLSVSRKQSLGESPLAGLFYAAQLKSDIFLSNGHTLHSDLAYDDVMALLPQDSLLNLDEVHAIAPHAVRDLEWDIEWHGESACYVKVASENGKRLLGIAAPAHDVREKIREAQLKQEPAATDHGL